MARAEQLLAAKRDFLVPCVYHFYQRPPVLVRGEGAYLFDSTGRRYLDCYCGVTVVSAGHSNPEILEAAINQLRQLQHTTTIYLTEPMLDLAPAIVCGAAKKQRESLKNPPLTVEQYLQSLERQGLVQTVATLRTFAESI